MKLRDLQLKDAPYMLEWMHDESVVKDFQADFLHKTIDDCTNFIQAANNSTNDLQQAIVDDNDEYMGTVSLRNIKDGTAEFAITIRAKAMGRGYSKEGMRAIIQKGFGERNLNKIYWCVSPDNKRACRFYDKNGYRRIRLTESERTKLIENGRYSAEQINGYRWYQIEKTDIK